LLACHRLRQRVASENRESLDFTLKRNRAERVQIVNGGAGAQFLAPRPRTVTGIGAFRAARHVFGMNVFGMDVFGIDVFRIDVFGINAARTAPSSVVIANGL
jgi:hypothetical protein